MNAQQKKFVLKKLIPFILREQGRGFGMAVWLEDKVPGQKFRVDNVSRKVPVCGTVACIGGSISALHGNKDWWDDEAGDAIGLEPSQAEALFHGWSPRHKDSGQWPKEFQKMYAKAKTSFAKAKVAVKLLNEVVKTNGNCLRTVEELQGE